MNVLTEFIRSLIPNDYLLVSLLSFLPLSEAKNGILMSISLKLDPFKYSILCFLCSSMIIPVVYYGIRHIISSTSAGSSKLLKPIIADLDRRAEKLGKNNADLWSIALFVAIPLPMTGLYSGSAIAAVAGIKPQKAVSALLIGNVISNALVLTVGIFLKDQAELIFWSLNFVSIFVFAFYFATIVLKSKIKKTKNRE